MNETEIFVRAPADSHYIKLGISPQQMFDKQVAELRSALDAAIAERPGLAAAVEDAERAYKQADAERQLLTTSLQRLDVELATAREEISRSPLEDLLADTNPAAARLAKLTAVRAELARRVDMVPAHVLREAQGQAVDRVAVNAGRIENLEVRLETLERRGAATDWDSGVFHVLGDGTTGVVGVSGTGRVIEVAAD